MAAALPRARPVDGAVGEGHRVEVGLAQRAGGLLGDDVAADSHNPMSTLSASDRRKGER